MFEMKFTMENRPTSPEAWGCYEHSLKRRRSFQASCAPG
jgi:hypothetical protein